MKHYKLTDKQKAFVRHFTELFNLEVLIGVERPQIGARAAARAGYGKHSRSYFAGKKCCELGAYRSLRSYKVRDALKDKGITVKDGVTGGVIIGTQQKE